MAKVRTPLGMPSSSWRRLQRFVLVQHQFQSPKQEGHMQAIQSDQSLILMTVRRELSDSQSGLKVEGVNRVLFTLHLSRFLLPTQPVLITKEMKNKPRSRWFWNRVSDSWDHGAENQSTETGNK